WLSKIAERQILHAARFHAAQKRSAPSRETGPTTIPGRGPTPTEDLIQMERAAVVDECLAQLPDEDREVIILREFLGAPCDVVAAETGRPSPDAARKRHGEAISRLDRLVRERLAS